MKHTAALAALVACLGAGCMSARPIPRVQSRAPQAASPVVVDQRVSGVLAAYGDRLACFGTSNVVCPSTTSVDLSSTDGAPLESLALAAADRAARVLAPRILDLKGRHAAARRMAALPPITSIAEARAASEILAPSIDEDAALGAWWRRRIGDWRGELGRSEPIPEASKPQLLELALYTLNETLRLEPEAPYLDWQPLPRDDQLVRAIIDTIDALEIAASAGLERGEAEKLATDTLTHLVATARRSSERRP